MGLRTFLSLGMPRRTSPLHSSFPILCERNLFCLRIPLFCKCWGQSKLGPSPAFRLRAHMIFFSCTWTRPRTFFANNKEPTKREYFLLRKRGKCLLDAGIPLTMRIFWWRDFGYRYSCSRKAFLAKVFGCEDGFYEDYFFLTIIAFWRPSASFRSFG